MGLSIKNSAYGPKIITDGLVLALDAANIKSYNAGISTTAWNDLSGGGRTASLTNGPTYSSANGGSIVFDGAYKYASLSGAGFGENNTTPTITLEVWANLNIPDVFSRVAWITNNLDFNFLFTLHNSGTIQARIATTTGTFDMGGSYSTYFNKWTHIVFAANVTRTDLYLNANLVGSNTNITGSFGSLLPDFLIGSPGIPYGPKGNISSAKVYNRALSAAEVSQNFNAFRGRYGI